MKNIKNFITGLLSDAHNAPQGLLQYLCCIQQHYSYIPEQAAELLADSLHIPAMQIFGVVDFYAFLHREARGDFDVYFSDSITDHMLGSRDLFDDLCDKLDIKPGLPRSDGRVTVDVTSCTGICDQGPALLVNGLVIPKLDVERIEKIAQLIETGTALTDWPPSFFCC